MPVLFASLGSATSAALRNAVVVGAVNVGSTLIAVAFSDKFGRRFLLIEGGIQCCLAMVSQGEVWVAMAVSPACLTKILALLYPSACHSPALQSASIQP